MKTGTIIALLTLIICALAACTDPPPDVGRDESALTYDDGGTGIINGEADLRTAWKLATKCKLTPSEWLFSSKDEDVVFDTGTLASEDGPGLVSAKSTCAKTNTEAGRAAGEAWCVVCCTTARVCAGSGGINVCWTEVRCEKPQCLRDVTDWPPP